MPRYKTPIKRSCNKCEHFHIFGGKFGVCKIGEHPSEQSECLSFSRSLKKLSLFLVFFLFSCSPRVITVPEVHTEYIVKTDTFLKRDSVIREHNTVIREADSAMLAELGLQLSDGQRAILVLRKEIERLSSMEREVKTDTFVRCDTIPYMVEVEKPLSWWERQKQDFGGFVLFVLFCVLVYLLFTKIKKQ